MTGRRLRLASVTMVVVGITTGCSGASSANRVASGAPGLHVADARLVDGAGHTVRLVGVNQSGTEYACVQGWRIFDERHDAAKVAAIASWHANVVRIGLNEDCWLGINGVPGEYSGMAHRRAIAEYVALLHREGLYAILELHWAAPGAVTAYQQRGMPEADHSPAFWHSVARAFRDDPYTIFDLFNEPDGVDWNCWRDGCLDTNEQPAYQTAGMASLLAAVRSAGAHNPVMLGGLANANGLDGWLSHRPFDVDHALIASWHVYDWNSCIDAACWDAEVLPVAREVPLVTGEVGLTDTCGTGVADAALSWLDRHELSYLSWAWNAWGDCGSLIRDDADFRPTAWGEEFRAHLRAL